MATIHFMPEGRTIVVRDGMTLLEAAKRERVAIRTRCGGVAGCLMCKVTIQEGEDLLPVTNKEQLKLGDSVERGVRLACQTRCYGKMTVIVPEDPLKAAVRAQLAKQKENEDGI